MSDPREYALGTNAAEIVRLGVQHRLWGAQAFSIWERANFRAGHTLLDVGCGPGYTSFDLAGVVTSTGRIVAIDLSEMYIEHLKQRQQLLGGTTIDARVGDVQKLELPKESFDGAYQRWTLCFVKDPEAVVSGVAHALTRGGAFAIQDYVNYEGILLAPETEPFRRFIRVVAEAWRDRGGDTEIGLHLPAMLAKHGLTPVEISPVHRIARPGSQLWTWPTIFIETYAPKLVEEGRLTAAEHAALVADWSEHTKDPNAFFVSPPMVDIIAVKR